MTVISVRLKNYKQHRDLSITPNGQSFFVVGDTDLGKTTLLDLIEASLMLRPFDEDFISDGAEAGKIEVEHELDGINYTIIRERKRNQKVASRFIVKDSNGGEHKLKALLEKIFGAAFTNSYFDHRKYFYEFKSSKDRYEYMVKAIGGDPVLSNNRLIKIHKEKRHAIGGDRTPIIALLSRSILDPDTLVQDREKYATAKTLEDAYNDEIYLSL